ncbi:CEQ_1a_G0020480.mRNA.1.CDS.1 [Saccharomyces cerevisiae]|nr:CEQ_1a_G0020480.mRNA.1.CDS.1 [Saccharomyces cerevisiae]CAI7302659.1 CEQ_1a_G0020480.mRNA.1.CDS.1 [Saccharomyces cerevisiae]
MSRQSAFKFQNGNRHERACLSDVHKILIIILYSTKGKRELGKRITHFMYIHIFCTYLYQASIVQYCSSTLLNVIAFSYLSFESYIQVRVHTAQ